MMGFRVLQSTMRNNRFLIFCKSLKMSLKQDGTIPGIMYGLFEVQKNVDSNCWPFWPILVAITTLT